MKMYTSVMENAVLVTCKTTGSRPLMMNGLLWLVVTGDLQGHPLWLFLVAIEPFSNWNILVPLFYLYVIFKYMCCHHEFSWKWNTAPVTLNNNQSINQFKFTITCVGTLHLRTFEKMYRLLLPTFSTYHLRTTIPVHTGK